MLSTLPRPTRKYRRAYHRYSPKVQALIYAMDTGVITRDEAWRIVELSYRLGLGVVVNP